MLNAKNTTQIIAWDRHYENSIPWLVDSPALLDHDLSHNLENETSCILFQGLITNRGHVCTRFGIAESISDENLILEIYHRFGMDVANYVFGPAAYVIWDCAQRALYVFRDRIGVYGFYYLLLNGRMYLSDQ